MTIYFRFNGCANNYSFQEKNVRTASEPKQTKVFEIEEVLKTDNTKDDDSENLKQTKKLMNKRSTIT